MTVAEQSQMAPAADAGKNRARRLDIDLLKAIGCVFVVLYHSRIVPLSEMGASSPLGYYLRALLSTCVPLFFLASGALYAKRDLTLRDAAGKACRLAVLTLFWAVVASTFFRVLEGEVISVQKLLVDAVSLRSGWAHFLWFLPSLAAAYLSAPFLIAVKKSSPSLWSGAVALVALLVFGMDALSNACTLYDGFFGSEFGSKVLGFVRRFNMMKGGHSEAIAYFALGMWLEERELPRGAGVLLPAGALLAPVLLAQRGLALHALTAESYDVTWNGYSSVATMISAASIYMLARRLSPTLGKNRVLVKLIGLVGRNSFAVYILHWFLRPLVFELAPRGISVLVAAGISLVVALAISVACALLGELIRRTPLRALFAS